MSFEHRIFDDAGFGIADSDARTPTVNVLLSRLNLMTARRVDQVAGLREWLREHQASASLVRSIERKGYSEALDELRQIAG